jgi:hypothetical protein
MISVTIKFTYITGTSFSKFRLYFQKVFFIINTLSLGTLCAGRVQLFAEAPELFTHDVFQLVVIRKTASSEYILKGAKNMEVGGWGVDSSSCLAETLEIIGLTALVSAHTALN